VKAVVLERYGAPGDVLALRDVPEPAIADGEVLVRVRATSVNPADWHAMRGTPYFARLQMGLRAPKMTVLGCDVAGEVEAVGEGVTRFRVGDEVFGSAYPRYGAFAERVSVPEERLAAKPATLSFEQAAAVPVAAMTALQGVRDHGRVEQGQKVLIIGASGGVGTFAVQLAKALGAEVTGVCSTRNVELVRSIGADAVIDYLRENPLQPAGHYDVVLQVAGTQSPSESRRALTPKGRLVAISGDSPGRWIGPLGRMVKAAALSPFVSQKLASFLVKPNSKDLEFLSELVEAGKLTPVLDRTHPLPEVPEAIGYLEEGHARGKVIVAV
jgi:NADPH:quinone reductase-like Zn-dependent oxidoreductase